MQKKFIVTCLLSIVAFTAKAQVPYFSSTAGDGNLYGYTSLKLRPGHNVQETYTCFQYGLGDIFATGVDLYIGGSSAYWGALLRVGKQYTPYFGIGAQVTPSFSLSDNFKYSYTTGAIYMNGNITKNGKLFWCSNTWFDFNKCADDTFSNWEYLGYSFIAGKGSINPMLGLEHDWKFRQNPDMLMGVYYSVRKWNIYLWGSDLCSAKANPRVVVGVDFKLPTKIK